MRGKRYDPGSRRVFSGGGYVGVIVAIIVLAALVAITLLAVLPTTEDMQQDEPKIVSISYDATDVGMGSNAGDVMLTVTYSNSETAQVSLSSMTHSGLDVSKAGIQNVSLSYGGFEDTIPINVKRVDCIRSYTASDGGGITGDAVQYVVSGQDADTVIAIPETGYTFVEWSDGYPYAKRKDLAVNESKEIMAKFEKTKFTVTFHFMDGTTNKEEKVVYGEKAVDVPDSNDPRMRVYGYTFVGWSVNEEDYSHVLRDMDIYPRYEKTATDVTVEVSKDKNGNVMGQTDAREEGYYAHSETERAVITATPDNSRSFKSWQVLNSDGRYVDIGRDSTEESTVEIGDNRVSVSFRVNAASDPGKYIISFLCNAEMDYVALKAIFAYDNSSLTFVNYQNKNTDNVECWVDDIPYTSTIGDKIAESGVETLVSGTEVQMDDDPLSTNFGLIVPAPVAGMTFDGWYLQGDPEQKTVTRDLYLNEPSVLIAKWQKKAYNLIFEYEDEEGEKQIYSDDVIVYYQNTVGSGGGVPAGVPSKKGYVFSGWEDAYTHTTVDDSMQIVMQDEYGTEIDSDFNQQIIRIIARWTPIRHDLRVEIIGEGHVTLLEKGGASRDILGIANIFEDASYSVLFTASEGYQIEYVEWEYKSEELEGGDSFNAENTYVYRYESKVVERADNDFVVKFIPKKYRISVTNGSDTDKGYVTVDGVMRNAEIINDIYVSEGESVALNVKSANEAYSIEKIFVTGSADGQTYDNALKADYEGTEDAVTECDLVFARCRSDLSVVIRYKSRTIAVSVGGNYDEDHPEVYYVKKTTFNGKEEDYSRPAAQEKYSYGTELFYTISAPEGQFITSLVMNGTIYDLYTCNPNVVCYDWKINGNPAGITLKKINEEYYYCYGEVELEDGGNYLYCERVSDREIAVFEAIDESTGEYLLVESAANAAGDGFASIRAYLEYILGIDERLLSDASVEKDNRVTEVKIMLLPERDISLSVTFDEIRYDIVVENSDLGTVEYEKETVSKGESVYFSAKPVTGYNIIGYSVGYIYYSVSDMTEGAGVEFTVENILEDVYVAIDYEIITYNVVFSNAGLANGDLFVEKDETLGENVNRKLASSVEYALEYASYARFTLRAEEGKCFAYVRVNGEAQPLPFMADTFEYTVYSATGSTRIVAECAPKGENENDSTYTVRFNANDAVSCSAEYGAEENVLWFVIREGYQYKAITLSGVKNSDSKVVTVNFSDPLPANVTMDDRTVKMTLDKTDFDGEAAATCTTVKETRVVTLVNHAPEGGTITGGGTVPFGNETGITVSAFDDYYVSSYKVNGKEISFAGLNWTEKYATKYEGKYKGGVYNLIVAEDAVVEVTFSLFTYRVSLDRNSINGTTTFFFDGDDGSNRIEHGKDLIVSMKADPGFHIARILINGLEMDYVPYTNIANDNTIHTYTYPSVHSDVSVYVVYDINRYNFRYELINGSANFIAEANTGNKLECPDATAFGTDMFTDIAHGENFSLVITPGLGKGYYIYSITIRYVGYEWGSRTRYYNEGFFDANGATVWFNNFLWDNNIAGSVGVTANIELISVVFKKRTFHVEATQSGDEGGGTIAMAITNSVNVNSDGAIFLFNGNGDDAERYKWVSNVIYREAEPGVFVETDIVYACEENVWGFRSGSIFYDMYFEYGLRIALTLAPEEGFDRTSFLFNEEERNENVFSNRYSFNIYRNTTIGVTYLTQTFEITLESSAYTANMSAVGKQNVYDYAAFELYKVTEEGQELLTAIHEGDNVTSVILDYGTKYILKITPNFEGYGSYLYNMQVNGLSIPYHDTGAVIYGGSGIRTVSEMNYKITTRIMEYNVSVDTAYEAEAIVQDAKNMVFGDDTNALSWGVTWAGSAAIRIKADVGYFVDKVRLEDVATGEFYTIGDFQEIGEDGYYEDGDHGWIFAIRVNDNDSIKGVRDVVTVYNVKKDVRVTVFFIRREFALTYEVNDENALEEIATELNADHINNYPYRSMSTRTSGGLTFMIRYYDDITALIRPADGYEIVAAAVEARSVTFDEESGTFVDRLDNNGNPITYRYALGRADGDDRTFTFHPAEGLQRFVDSALIIHIDILIKEYRLVTNINRTNAVNDKSATKNETEVKATVLTKDAQYVQVGGSDQGVALFKANATTVPTLTAQHHGSVEYAFVASAGYMLYNFRVNGFSIEELQQANNGILLEYTMTMTSTRASDGTPFQGYSYTILLKVNTALLRGADGYVSDGAVRVSFDVTPITYNVRIVLNGEVMPFTTVGNKIGVTDGQQIVIYTAETVRHFGTLNIEPSLYEGYKITDTQTNIRIGMSAFGANELPCGFQRDGEVVAGHKTFSVTTDAVANADVSIGYDTIYFYYNTTIKKYVQKISAQAFESRDGSMQTGILSNFPDAGTVTISYEVRENGKVVTEDGAAKVETVGLHESGVAMFANEFEYFSVINIVAKANSGYAVYGIYEVFADGSEAKIVSGQRAISYNERNGEYTVRIEVKDLIAKDSVTGDDIITELGDRTFRVDIKQRTNLTLSVENPYKYIAANGRYYSYLNVTAYTAEHELTDGVPTADLVLGTSVPQTTLAVDTYQYTVYIGNYVKFTFYDTYAKANVEVKIYPTDLRETNGQTTSASLTDMEATGVGYRIETDGSVYYAYAAVKARISVTRTTTGAVTSTSAGTVHLDVNGGTQDSDSAVFTTVSSDSLDTTPTNTLTVTLTPENSYVFARLKVRQMNRTKSLTQGYIAFRTADAEKWNTITKDDISAAAIERFNNDETTNIKIKSIVAGDNGAYVFTFWVCGDAEITVDFHRVYTITCGIYLSDRVEQEGLQNGLLSSGITVRRVQDEMFGSTAFVTDANGLLLNTTATISYGAQFNVQATKPAGDYQFVGWYANDYDLYSYLRTLLPTDEYLSETITVNADEMQSLMQNGREVTEIKLYAVFQPIIDVMIYNEKYYAYEGHFNSWNLLSVLASYYPFTRGEPIKASDTDVRVRDAEGRDIMGTIAYLNEADVNVYSKAWSSLLAGTDAVKGYLESNKTEMLANRVYSSYSEFTILHQNITNSDYFTMSWTDTKITLGIANRAETAVFSSWQYFRWDTQEWVDIPYQYKGSGTSSRVNVDSGYTNYVIDIGDALFRIHDGSVLEDDSEKSYYGSVAMPYAVNCANERNVATNASDIRPLLIRPSMYQSINVNLIQNLYASDLAKEDPEQTIMPTSLVTPKIDRDRIVDQTPGMNRSVTPSPFNKGTYEYGTTITLVNNASNPGGEIISGNMRYRFLGWFVRYKDNTGKYQLYYLPNSERDASGSPYFAVRMTCTSDTSETNVIFSAVYVLQYQQNVYSYNISGSSSTSSNVDTRTARSYVASSTASFEASPILTVTTQTQDSESTPGAIPFPTFPMTGNDIRYTNPGTVNKYYWVNNVNVNSQTQTRDRANAPVQEGNEYVQKHFSVSGRSIEYYFDVGCTFDIKMQETPSAATTQAMLESIKTSSAMGYCAETDTMYKYVKNRDVLANYSAYYNTGKGIYYDAANGKVVSAAEMTSDAYARYGIVNNNKADTKQSNTYQMSYVSTATLLFYNLTYQGGVSVTTEMARLLTGGKRDLTVWDECTDYGDYNSVVNGRPVALNANGEVVIRLTLIGVFNNGFDGDFKFAYAGMKDGYGIKTKNKIRTTGSALLSPIKDTTGKFTRWQEVDLSSYYSNETVDGVTYNPTSLFGYTSSYKGSANAADQQVGKHTPTPAKYTSANCGTAVSGYVITTPQQIRHIETFWTNNNYSCVGIIVPKSFKLFDEDREYTPMFEEENGPLTANFENYYGRTTFKLCASYINLIGLSSTAKSNDPTASKNAWIPICDVGSEWAENEEYLYGTNSMPQRMYGFDGILEGNGMTIGGMAVKNYYGECYGLFARISGGIVQNLVVDNAYVVVSGTYVGLVAGYSQYSTFSNISFTRKSSYALYAGGSLGATASAGARIFMRTDSAEAAGLLSGYMESCNVSNVKITTGDGKYQVELISGGSAGLLAGVVCGESFVGQTTLSGGNVSAWIRVTAENAGGLIGMLSGESVVRTVNVDANANMFVGDDATVCSGGVVGFINSLKASLENVTFTASVTGSGNGTADDFRYDLYSYTVYGKGVYLFAKETKPTFDSLTKTSVGKAGLLVGYNRGVVTNTNSDGGYDTVKGVIKMHAGVMGGLVGVNTGRVTGFSLGTGFSSGYSGVTVLAWIRHKDTGDYAVGGVVGANLTTETTSKTEGGRTIDEAGTVEVGTWSLYGVVDDCSVVGINDVVSTDIGSHTNWNVGHLYAFMRTSGDYDQATETGYRTISRGTGASAFGWTYKHSLAIGGIVGYNKGSIFNSFVVKSKVTYKAETDATSQDTGRGRYAWMVRGGVLAGFHDPDATGLESSGSGDKWMQGWYQLLNNALMTPDTFMQANNTVSRRIQSCYVKNSSIVVVGRSYMDNSAFWSGNSPSGSGQDRTPRESKPVGIALSSVVGATNQNATAGMTFNACYSSGNQMIYDITPHGSASGSENQDNNNDGWSRLHDEKSGGLFGFSHEDYYYTWVKRLFFVVELRLNSYAPGLCQDYRTADGGSISIDPIVFVGSGDALYASSLYGGEDGNTEHDYGSSSSYRRSSDSNSSWWGGSSGGFPGQDGYRVNRYGSEAASPILASDVGNLTGAQTTSAITNSNSGSGMFMVGGKVIKTDVKSGLLQWAHSGSIMLRKGEYVKSYGTKAAAFAVDGEYWTTYYNVTDDVGMANNYVRGQ